MSTDDLVFYDVDTPVDDLIEQMHKNMPTLAVREVNVLDAARAVEGEVWSPQLPA